MTRSLEERRKEDFDFFLLCHAKGDSAMYELLRDRSLDPPKAPSPGEVEYQSWIDEIRSRA